MKAVLGWFAVMLATAIVGPLAAYHTALASDWFHDAMGLYDAAYGFSLPIHVVQSAHPGWPILFVIWTMLAVFGFAGWRLGLALSDAQASWGAALLIYLVLAIALSFSAVIQSVDVYYYVAFGRIFGVHGLNPYFLPKAFDAGGDTSLLQVLRYVKNPPYNDPYGPLWTLLAGALAKASVGLSLFWQVWSYRVFAVLAAATTLAGIAHALARLPRPQRAQAVARVAFHPLFLYETAVGAHNEILMVAPAVWAFAIVDDLPLVAALLMGASIAIKYMSVIALPFLLWRVFAKSAPAGAIALLIAVGLPVLCFKPFWVGGVALYATAGHINALGMSPTWLVAAPFFAAGMGGTIWPRAIQGAFVLAFLVVAAASFLRFTRVGRYADIWRTITAFLWASPIIQPWYLLMLAPAAAGADRWAVYAWWFCALIPLRYALEGVAGTPLWLLVILTLVILAVPVLLAFRLPTWGQPPGRPVT